MLIAYFVGKAWASVLPRGDLQEARWRQQGGQGKLPPLIRLARLINPGPWNLKEHAVCSITATSASNAAASIFVFTAQDLFYDLPLSANTVVLSVISIGLFGYGICGIVRPICVWHVESVYWSNLPTVKTLQGLHWQDLKSSKPLRVFWYSFVGMAVYEVFPAYIFPWLNSISIPCLASMNATGDKASTLTNLFGGATNNEGLGLFTVSLDWQYVRNHLHGPSWSSVPRETTETDRGIHIDYLSPDIAAPQAASPPGSWLPDMHSGDARRLLYECMGCQSAAFHVYTTPNCQRQVIPHRTGLCRGCSR